MSTDLAVGPDLRFPLDAITQSIALLAVRRAGKSNAAAVMAEEMHRAGLPWVAIDPKGDWWGLRSSADGKSPGLPVPIFGGLHGDMPLVPEAGKLIAELITEENLTCVLDVSEFASKAAQMRFLTDLGEHLFRLHGRNPQPRHLFLEEADEFIPQRVMREQARCVGAWTKIVKQGGSRGLGHHDHLPALRRGRQGCTHADRDDDRAADHEPAGPQGHPGLGVLPRRSQAS